MRRKKLTLAQELLLDEIVLHSSGHPSYVDPAYRPLRALRDLRLVRHSGVNRWIATKLGRSVATRGGFLEAK